MRPHLELKSMQSNRTKQQYSGGSLSEPHFDDEATLLSARPVVPLHEIKAAERSNWRLTLGLTLVVAVLGGAFGATLIYRQQRQAPATANLEIAPASGETATPDGGETTPEVATGMEPSGGAADAPAPAASASAKASTVSDVPVRESRESVPRLRKSATSVAQTAVNPDETVPEEVNSPEDELAARRAERREARRQWREAQRESWGDVRRRRVQRADDLLRIREIFEGPQRPPRFQRWQ
jgi:hypothetical protein